MSLSVDLISQFAKLTKNDKKTNSETTVYGETVEYDGRMYVKFDGSELLTPVVTTTNMSAGERVSVLIKNHSATVTGNITSPSVTTGDVSDMTDDISQMGSKISEFEIIVADALTTEELNVERGRIDSLVSDNVIIHQTLEAVGADIGSLETDYATVNERLTANEASIESLDATKLDVEVADAKYATIESLNATDADIHNLEATYADFTVATTNTLSAIQGNISDLQADKLDAETASITYANIDFSNIGEAAMEYLYSQSGLIENVVVNNQTITGKLVGVTISGDRIEGNTVVADKLVIQGDDGLYYKLNTDGIKVEAQQTDYNSLNGQVIKAQSITASKIAVDDLVAFDATIGGFNITDNAIYSGVKSSATNSTRGVYLDKDGQLSVGDSDNYVKYYRDQNGVFKLGISADSMTIGASNRNVETLIDDIDSRMSSAETQIAQNTDDISLRATKTELTTLSNNLSNNYYTKTQTDSKIQVEANKISSAVSRISANETAISELAQTADGFTASLVTTNSNVSTALARTTVNDTRSTNESPSWYITNYPKQTVIEFKYCNVIGVSGDTYCSLQTVVPWGNSSGGYPKQTAMVKDKQYWRTGTSATTWSSWMAASETATNFLSFDSTNGVLIGNKTSGSWSGTKAQITSSAFNILDQNGVTLSSYGANTTIGKTSGNNIYIDSDDGIDIRRNGSVVATFDQYGLKIANTNDSNGSLGSGTTKPALVIGTPTGYHIEMDNNEIMAKSNATTSSHLFLNMEGGNVSFNNNANRAMMFQEGALYAKNASFNDGNYAGVLDAINDDGNTVLGFGGYQNSFGGTNIYGNSVNIISKGNLDVEASWINCRSITPNTNATYSLGKYGEKGWSNIYLGKGDNRTNALHIVVGSSTYLLCGVNADNQYVFGNNAAIMYYQAKDVNTSNQGNSFKITSGNNAAANNTNSVWLFGGADATSRYIGSYMAYSRTYSSAANMFVTGNGVFGRSTSSSERYKNSIVEADISELKGLYNLPIKKFKYNSDYIAQDDELYDKYLYGFIVEDLESILPCAVQHIEDQNGDSIPEMWNNNIIVPSLLKLIQDLNNRVIELEKKG